MAKQLTHIDIDSVHDFPQLIDDVCTHGTSVMLTRDSEDIAVIEPATRPRRRRTTRQKANGRDDALLSIIGMFPAEPGEPTDVAENHDKYLAEAYLDTHA